MNFLIIVIVAILLGAFTWLGFYIYDKKQDKHLESSEYVDENTSYRNIEGIDYKLYMMSTRERILNVLLAGIIFYAIGFIFYQNHIVSFVLSLVGFIYPRYRKKQLIEKRKQELTLQFKQFLYSLSSSVTVGKSVENAFREIVEDLKMLYPDPNTYIIHEIERMNRKIENGDTIENALLDFSSRTDVEDIASFADVFIISKRTGGDLNEIIRKTSTIIGDKIEIQQEIAIMVAQKKFESRILNIAPFIIVALLSFSSPDYMYPLYSLKEGGPIIMTIALLLLISSFIISERIMRIKV